MRWFLSAALLAAAPALAQDASEPLDGLGVGQVEALLGEPELLTRDNPVQIWQYGNDVCVIHVFFYPETDGGPLLVEYVETRMRDGFADRPDLCQTALAGEPVDAALEDPQPPEAQPVDGPVEPDPTVVQPTPTDIAPEPDTPAPVPQDVEDPVPPADPARPEIEEPVSDLPEEPAPPAETATAAEPLPAQPIIPFREPAQRRTPVQIDMVPLN